VVAMAVPLMNARTFLIHATSGKPICAFNDAMEIADNTLDDQCWHCRNTQQSELVAERKTEESLQKPAEAGAEPPGADNPLKNGMKLENRRSSPPEIDSVQDERP
jgi:hypothetical protein